uniref:Uncharacterized protein n=1 Tax=Romanomermis culicivorax TaxID=13658 RepID=A0A915HPQ9_ROMCU
MSIMKNIKFMNSKQWRIQFDLLGVWRHRPLMQTVQPMESHLDEDELFPMFFGDPLLLKPLFKFARSIGAN